MNDNNELVFAKGKDGHYRYISKKELKRQILPIRILTFCFYFIIFGVILGGAYYIFTDVYEVYLVKDNMLIDNGNAYQIELLPKNSKYFDYENYIYESDNTKIATVDRYGQITAVSNGTCNISVRYKYGIEKKTMRVDVRNIEVKTLTIDNDAVDKNNTNKAEVIVNNNESLKTKLTYKSSNEEVLKVDDNGNLVGVDEGKAKVTVTSPSGVTEEKTIEVKTSKDEIQEIKIKENDILLKKGESKKLTLSVVPSNASTKDVSWDSTDKSIVSVDQDGRRKA